MKLSFKLICAMLLLYSAPALCMKWFAKLCCSCTQQEVKVAPASLPLPLRAVDYELKLEQVEEVKVNQARDSASNTVVRPEMKDNDSEVMMVRLPVAEVLEKRISALGLGDFLQKTGIHKRLGNVKVFATGVVMTVDCALYDYEKFFSDRAMARCLNTLHRGRLMRTILQDYPEAIEMLIKKKILLEEKSS